MNNVPVVVTDRAVQYPTRFKLTDADTGRVLGVFDLAREPGSIAEDGSVIGKKLLEDIERAMMEYADTVGEEVKRFGKVHRTTTFQKIMTGGLR